MRREDLVNIVVFGGSGTGVVGSLILLYLFVNASQTGWRTVAAFDLYGEAWAEAVAFAAMLALSLAAALLALRRTFAFSKTSTVKGSCR